MLCKILLFSFAAIGLVAGRATTMSREQQLQELLRRECKRYGAEDKVPELVAASNKFSDCVLENISMLDMVALQRASDEDAPEAVLAFVRQLCKKKSELEVCLFNVLDAAMPCTDPTVRDKLDIHKYALQDLGNYTCKNNAQIVSDMFEDGAVECFQSKMIRLKICLMDIEHEDLESMSVAEGCQKVTELRNCIVNTLKQCPKPTLADFVAKNLDAVMKGSRCDNNDYYSVSLRGTEEAEDMLNEITLT